jgi:hypothetical protein
MQSPYDKRKLLEKQDFVLAAAAAVCLVAASLDPDGVWLRTGPRAILLTAGTGSAGWFLAQCLRAAGFFEAVLDRSGKRLVLGALAGIHLLATLFFFPPRDILNSKPVVTLDHSFHYYQAVRGSTVFRRSARLHCYDPYFMAGYPSVVFDLDVKAAELFCAPFPRDGVARALKVFILLCYLSMVATIYKGTRYLGFSSREALLALMMFLAYWHWGRPLASHFRYAGMFEFVLGSHLALLVAGLFRRFLTVGKARAFFILGPITFLVHPTALVILLVPFVVILATARPPLTFRRSVTFGVWCAVVLAVNAVWIVPLLEYTGVKTPSGTFFEIRGAAAFAEVLFRTGSLVAGAFILLAVTGALRMAHLRRGVDALVPVLTSVFLLAVATFGAESHLLSQLEPGRFLFAVFVFLAPLAGSGLDGLLGVADRAIRSARIRLPVVASMLAILAVSPLPLSFLSARTGYAQRITTHLAPDVVKLIAALEAHVNPSGRLMIEDGGADLYGNSHVPGMLPLYTGVEQIGGPYPWTFVRHHFATFQVDDTMGRPLADLDAGTFLSHAELYNVRWIVTASSDASAYVARVGEAPPDSGAPPGPVGGTQRPLVRKVWNSGPYTLWALSGRHSWARTEPIVEADFDRIVAVTSDPEEPFVLKYHWDKGLRAVAPAEIAPFRRLDDPVPFILVKPNGEMRVQITF